MRAFIVISAGFCLMLNPAPSFSADCGDLGIKCVAAPSAEDIGALSNECAVVKGFLLTQTLLTHSSGTLSDAIGNDELIMDRISWFKISKKVTERAKLLAASIRNLSSYMNSAELKKSIKSAGLYLRDSVPDDIVFNEKMDFQNEIVNAETESTQSLLKLKRAYEKNCIAKD